MTALKLTASRSLIGLVLLLPAPGWAAEALQPPALNAPPRALPAIASEESATFAQLATQVGDRVAQSVGVELQLHTTITQAGQQASDNQTALKRRQQKFVEVLEVVEGHVRRAHVTFPISRLTAGVENQTDGGKEITQPVEAQGYFVTRQGEQLLVTDADGAIPPQAEYEIVVNSLRDFGLPNPLIAFLRGRTVRVGERLKLPQQIAEQVMGFGDQFSKVEAFELELKSLQEIEGQRSAVFAATVAAVGEASSPVRIRAFGQVVIQIETCRIVRAELSGPLTLSTVEHTPAGDFQYSARGNMRVAVRAKYGRARK